MPALNPAQLQVGQRYTHVNAYGRGTKRYLGTNGQGWPQFNAGQGGAASFNPAITTFYAEGNANIPPNQGAPGAGAGAGAGPMNLEGGRRRRRGSRKQRKSRKGRKGATRRR